MIQATIRIYTLLIILISSQLHAMSSEEQKAKINQIGTLGDLVELIKQRPKEETAKEKIDKLTDDLARGLSYPVITQYFNLDKKYRSSKETDQIKKTQEIFWKRIKTLEPSFLKKTIELMVYEIDTTLKGKEKNYPAVTSYEILDAASLVMNGMLDQIETLEKEINKLKSEAKQQTYAPKSPKASSPKNFKTLFPKSPKALSPRKPKIPSPRSPKVLMLREFDRRQN